MRLFRAVFRMGVAMAVGGTVLAAEKLPGTFDPGLGHGNGGRLGEPPIYFQPDLPFGAQPPASSVAEFYHALGFLKSEAGKLEKTLGDRAPEAKESLIQIQSDAQFLQEQWLNWPRKHPNQLPYKGGGRSDPYLRSIQAAQKQLKGFTKKQTEQMITVVKAIGKDVHVKAENCRHATDGLGKELKVTVRTKRGTAEVSGYQVWCAPVALADLKDEHLRFPKLSSPTSFKNLAPGYYSLWAVKDGERSDPIPQTVGGHGESEIEIDLSLAAGSGAGP